MDNLSKLPIDLFINQITYLSFDSVISICSTNKTLHSYCTDPKYYIRWESLINNTFSNVCNYQEKLKQIQTKLNTNGYNYLVYTQLIKLLDPVTQAMIYYKQGDMNSFDKFSNEKKFLALYVANKRSIIEKYLPNDSYKLLLTPGKKKYTRTVNYLFNELVTYNNMRGIKLFLDEFDISSDMIVIAVLFGAKNLKVEVLEYLISKGADIHYHDDELFRIACYYGNLNIVKYTLKHKSNIHEFDDIGLKDACHEGHLEVVKYLIKHGANINTNHENDSPLVHACRGGHLNIVKYLVEHGVIVHMNDDRVTYPDEPLEAAHRRGFSNIVNYLIEHGAIMDNIETGPYYEFKNNAN